MNSERVQNSNARQAVSRRAFSIRCCSHAVCFRARRRWEVAQEHVVDYVEEVSDVDISLGSYISLAQARRCLPTSGLQSAPSEQELRQGKGGVDRATKKPGR